MVEPTPSEQIYRPHLRYRLMALISLLLAALFARDVAEPLWRGELPAFDALFFLLTMLGVGLWLARTAGTRIRVTERGVTLQAPLAAPSTVEYRQLLSVHESERLSRAITLLYHPTQRDGLLDLDRVHSLILPEVPENGALLAELEARVPR